MSKNMNGYELSELAVGFTVLLGCLLAGTSSLASISTLTE